MIEAVASGSVADEKLARAQEEAAEPEGKPKVDEGEKEKVEK